MTDPNIAQNTTSSTPESAGTIGQFLAQLRAALAIPKTDRVPDWEATTARLVALVAVDYVKQPDDSIALQDLALVHLAGTRGCKAARKRELSPVRWRERTPPRLSETFADADEASAAVTGLSTLRTDWVVPFALEELRSRRLTAAHAELISWAAANSSSLASLLSAVVSAFPPSDSDARDVLFDTVALLLRPEFLVARTVGEDFFLLLVDLIVQAATSSSAQPGKARNLHIESLAVQAVGALDALTSLRPALLVQPASTALLREAGKRVPHWPTPMKQAVTRLLQRAVSLLEYLQSIDSGSTGSLIADFSKGYAAALPAATKTVPERDALMRLGIPMPCSREREVTTAAVGEIELSMATLLTEWDAFATAAGTSAEVAQIGRQIDAVARFAHVERFGAPGEVIPYEPLQHHLAVAMDGPPLRVLIIKPGVRKLRPDGSFRVILKALVDPRDNAVER